MSCLEHLKDLSVNKQRRAFENMRNKNEKINANMRTMIGFHW